MEERDITEAPYAEWLEDGLKTIFEHDPVCIAVVANIGNGDMLTGYWNTTVNDKFLMAKHIEIDAMREALRGSEEDEEDEEE